MSAPRLDIGILAAGASRRMRGRDKLLEDVFGEPLLRRVAIRALAIEGAHVLVAVRSDAAYKTVLEGLAVEVVTVPDADLGMGRSIAALAAVNAHRPLMLMLADMPDIGVRDISALVSRFDALDSLRPVRAATPDGPGHPVILPAALRPALSDLHGDRGPREMLQDAALVEVPGARTDLDTPEDWAAWRDK